MFSSLFGFGSSPPPPTAPAAAAPSPSVAAGVSALTSMGFSRSASLYALNLNRGDVNGAVAFLIANDGRVPPEAHTDEESSASAGQGATYADVPSSSSSSSSYSYSSSGKRTAGPPSSPPLAVSSRPAAAAAAAAASSDDDELKRAMSLSLACARSTAAAAADDELNSAISLSLEAASSNASASTKNHSTAVAAPPPARVVAPSSSRVVPPPVPPHSSHNAASAASSASQKAVGAALARREQQEQRPSTTQTSTSTSTSSSSTSSSSLNQSGWLHRLSLRVSTSSLLVDTLFKTLSTIIANPYERRYCVIDMQAPEFIRVFGHYKDGGAASDARSSSTSGRGAGTTSKRRQHDKETNAVGGVDFLLAAGFEIRGGGGGATSSSSSSSFSFSSPQQQQQQQRFLSLPFPLSVSSLSTLEICASTLSSLRTSSLNYLKDLSYRRFRLDMLNALYLHDVKDDKALDREAVRRGEYGRCVPSEPSGGYSCAVVTVIFGKVEDAVLPATTTTDGGAKSSRSGGSHEVTRFGRRFSGDDTVRDLLNWLAAIGTASKDKLVSGEWLLLDVNKFPMTVVEVPKKETDEGGTLQANGFWPSATLCIRGKEEFEMKGDTTTSE